MGLIIAFSVSGLFLNHRQAWHPLRYEFGTSAIHVPEEILSKEITNDVVDEIAKSQNIQDKLRRFGVDGERVWISFENADLEFNKSNGEGKLKIFKITPVLGQMTLLHISTSKFWIYYSDIFAIALLIIAISAMVFPKGQKGFKKYGWKLVLAGLAFPLIFLFFLS